MKLLVVVGDIPIRIIVGYGVQDNATKEKKDKLWDFMEKLNLRNSSDGWKPSCW